MEGTRKAFDTPYGSSVISEQPLVTPDIGPRHADAIAAGAAKLMGSKQTLPGTQQMCGPCSGGGFCPIHSPQGHAAAGVWGVISGTAQTPPETLGTIVGDFLERLVGHVTQRVTAEIRQELREMEDRLQLSIGLAAQDHEGIDEDPAPRPFKELGFIQLADMLDEIGITNSFVIDVNDVVEGLVVRDPMHTDSVGFVDADVLGVAFRYRVLDATTEFMSLESLNEWFKARLETKRRLGDDPPPSQG